ncbi:MAG: hypothetical protein ACI906_003696 [Candidatus Latescibacterota bacterium]
MSEIICRENGKTRDEAHGDVRRGIEVVELACGVGQSAKGEILPELANRIDGTATREPWVYAPVSRRLISRRWCRYGCIPSPSPAVIFLC